MGGLCEQFQSIPCFLFSHHTQMLQFILIINNIHWSFIIAAMCTNSINVHRIFWANCHNHLQLTEEETEAQDIFNFFYLTDISFHLFYILTTDPPPSSPPVPPPATPIYPPPPLYSAHPSHGLKQSMADQVEVGLCIKTGWGNPPWGPKSQLRARDRSWCHC